MEKDVRKVTICFVVKGGVVLLGMKKRGFGEGLWNGFGGKVEDETIEESLARELKEEIGITFETPEKVGIIKFRFEEGKNDWDQDAHVYLIKEWQGEPKASEEMLPEWFEFSEIPYDKMWDADKYWVPLILSGKKIKATIYFDENNRTQKREIGEVYEL